jgi:hypothetical protein
MGVKQRFLEADLYYEVDDFFVSKLKDFPRNVGIDIASQVNVSYEDLPTRSGWTQTIGGVCNETNPALFFEVEYLNQDEEPPLFLDINPIDSDDYLDYILEKNILKSKSNAKSQTTTNKRSFS